MSLANAEREQRDMHEEDMKDQAKQERATEFSLREVVARLSEASTRFLAMMSAADTDISSETKRLFDMAHLATTRGLTDARDLNDEYKARLIAIKRKIKELRKLSADIKSRHNALRLHVHEVIRQTPGVVYRDEDGVRVFTAKNGKPALKYIFTLGKKTVGNIADPMIVPAKYLKAETHLVLDTELVRADLEAGAVLPWAQLERGTQLRGL